MIIKDIFIICIMPATFGPIVDRSEDAARGRVFIQYRTKRCPGVMQYKD